MRTPALPAIELLLLAGLAACVPPDDEGRDLVVADEVAARLAATGTAEAWITMDLPAGSPSDGASWRAEITRLHDQLDSCGGLRGATVLRRLKALPMVRATIGPEHVRLLRDCSIVVAIDDPPAPEISLAQTLPAIRAEGAWRAGFGGAGTTIAVVDSSLVARVDPQLGDCSQGPGTRTCRFSAWYDAIDDDADPIGCSDHGQNVSAIAASVAPDADLLFVRAGGQLNNDGVCERRIPEIPAAMDWILSNIDTTPVDVINMSFGDDRFDSIACDSVGSYGTTLDALERAGVVLVAAAGNDYDNAGANQFTEGISHPACRSSVIAVAAATDAGDLSDFTQRGPLVDLAAPGVSVEAGVNAAGAVLRKSGTSMATPHVAGAVAVLRQVTPGATPAAIRNALRATSSIARDPDRAGTGYPSLDLVDSVSGVGQQPTVLTQTWLDWVPFDWGEGAWPAVVEVDGHPIPVATVLPDDVVVSYDVTEYLRPGPAIAAGFRSLDDPHLFVRDVNLRDTLGTTWPLSTPAGPADSAPWSHVGPVRFDADAQAFAPPRQGPGTIRLNVFGAQHTDDLRLRLNGTAVGLLPRVLDPDGDVLVQTVSELVYDDDANVITVHNFTPSEVWVSSVELEVSMRTIQLVAMEPGPHDMGSTYRVGDNSWAHVGDSAAMPDTPWVTFIDPTQPRELTVRFEVRGLDGATGAAIVLNGAWLRQPASAWPDGTLVELTARGVSRRGGRPLVTFHNHLDPSYEVRLVEVVDGTRTAALHSGSRPTDQGDWLHVLAAGAGGLPGRTWTAPFERSDLRIFSERVALHPNETRPAASRLLHPAGFTCVPTVTWEKIVERPSPRCDHHATMRTSAGITEFDLQLEHCGYGQPTTREAAVARTTLWCLEDDAGFIDTIDVGYGRYATAPVEAWLPIPARTTQPVFAMCGLTWMDGNGDKDTGGKCHWEQSSSGIRVWQSKGCNHSNKESGGSRLLAFTPPPDVDVTAVPFEVHSREVIRHRYADDGRDHLAFVVPRGVHTSCDDHSEFHSECLDTGSELICTLEKRGSISHYLGQVLFLDGHFPETEAR